MPKNIVLFCAAGMSTSLLVEKMKEAAAKLDYDCKINAYSMTKVKDYAPGADIILLGPQIRFQKAEIAGKYPNIPVEDINMMDYGMMNGEKIIRHVMDVLK